MYVCRSVGIVVLIKSSGGGAIFFKYLLYIARQNLFVAKEMTKNGLRIVFSMKKIEF